MLNKYLKKKKKVLEDKKMYLSTWKHPLKVCSEKITKFWSENWTSRFEKLDTLKETMQLQSFDKKENPYMVTSQLYRQYPIRGEGRGWNGAQYVYTGEFGITNSHECSEKAHV